MLTTNLLPPERKKMMEFEMARRLFLFLAVGFSAVFLLGAGLLLPSFILLYSEEQSLKEALEFERKVSVDRKVDQVFLKTQSTRSRLSLITAASSEPPRTSQILGDFLDDAQRSGVTLTYFSARKDGSFAVTGVAPGRRNLLNFEKNLRDSGKFQEINYPLSSILPGTNIRFTFQGRFKPPHGL